MPVHFELCSDVDAAEKIAQQENATRLADVSQLASDAYELIADLIRCVLTKPPERCPERETVALKLLCRLLDDLHCARMLALSGYPARACALAASAFEAAFVASDVVHSEENARRWIEHSEALRRSASP